MRVKQANRKVVIVANTSWYLWNFRLNLMLLLQREGVEVIAVAPADDYSSRFAEHGIRFIPLAMSRRGKNPLGEVRAMANLYRIFRRERPGMVLTYTPKANIYASIAAHRCGIPVANNVAGLGYAFVRQGVLPRLIKLLYRVAFSRSRKVYFQNEDDLGLFVGEGIVAARLAERLPGSGVDTEKFSPRERGEGPFTFLLVARLLWDKGIGEYVEAARLVRRSAPHAVFQLLGPLDDGNPSAISRSQVEEWRAEGIVEYLGATDSVTEYLAKADCVVLPSAYREGVPRSLLEAASMARPVLTTDTTGCRDVVDDGITGFLCKVRDAAGLAANMGRVLAMEEGERREMGLRGRMKMIRQFSEGIVLDRYLELVSSTLGFSRVRPGTAAAAVSKQARTACTADAETVVAQTAA